MEPSSFDEIAFFRAVARSGARALLIGRRALVLLGLPVLTADYDFWIAIEDIGAFNETGKQFDLRPTRAPSRACGSVAAPCRSPTPTCICRRSMTSSSPSRSLRVPRTWRIFAYCGF